MHAMVKIRRPELDPFNKPAFGQAQPSVAKSNYYSVFESQSGINNRQEEAKAVNQAVNQSSIFSGSVEES